MSFRERCTATTYRQAWPLTTKAARFVTNAESERGAIESVLFGLR